MNRRSNLQSLVAKTKKAADDCVCAQIVQDGSAQAVSAAMTETAIAEGNYAVQREALSKEYQKMDLRGMCFKHMQYPHSMIKIDGYWDNCKGTRIFSGCLINSNPDHYFMRKLRNATCILGYYEPATVQEFKANEQQFMRYIEG